MDTDSRSISAVDRQRAGVHDGSIQKRLLLGVAALTLALAPIGADAAFPGANGRIAFLSVRADGGVELYTMKADGRGVDRLTAHSPLVYAAPAWSPDGRTIAIVHSFEDRVMLFDVASRRLRRPAVPILTAGRISWSPNARRVVYTEYAGPDVSHVWIARADGTARRRLTSARTYDSSPAWSPTGRRVAFVRLRRGDDLMTVGVDGRGLRLLGRGSSPSWSPDGRRLAFTATSPRGRSVIGVVNADGSSRRTLISDPHCDVGAPAWSRRGTVAFVANCEGFDAIQAIAANGRNRRTLVRGSFFSFRDAVMSWSPNGAEFAYALDGRARIAKADGSGSRPMFPLPSGATGPPAWSPDGRRLAAPLWPATTPRPPELVDSPVGSPAWSPDGRSLIGTRGDAGEDVVLVDLASGDERVIYEDEGIGYWTVSSPAWSPKGGVIAFVVEDDETITLYDLDRADFVHFSYRGSARDPAWSPDGERLAFDTGSLQLPRRQPSIFVTRADGTGARRIARNASEPAWSPDGRKIVFVRSVTRGNEELFVMNADGTEQRRLTFNPGADVEPDWQPVVTGLSG